MHKQVQPHFHHATVLISHGPRHLVLVPIFRYRWLLPRIEQKQLLLHTLLPHTSTLDYLVHQLLCQQHGMLPMVQQLPQQHILYHTQRRVHPVVLVLERVLKGLRVLLGGGVSHFPL